jgi:pimeloyl-ACP methyl ester carboxylesterase
MNPLFFGTSAHPLYGVYHAPRAQHGRKTGIVLCYPFGQEYMRAHRAFRQLSLSLSKSGFHVLRFDYSGSGDSSGDAAAFGIAASVADVGIAIDELRDTADLERVLLLGMRLGGSIAALSAMDRDDVSHLVLWDPVADGSSYVDELLSGVDAARTTGTVGVMGYPVTVALQNELRSMRISQLVSEACTQLLLTCDADTTDERSLERGLAAPGRTVTFMHAPLPGRWNEVDNWGSAMLPQSTIQSIVGWIEREVP